MLVVNFFAGPGAGKSTNALGVTYKLKQKGINAELAHEFAKDLTWEHRLVALKNQPYIFGKQYHKLHRLENEVDVVVTDSPILLSILYAENEPPSFQEYVFAKFNQYKNLNYFVRRDPSKYLAKGRNQNLEEAQAIDEATLNLLKTHNVSYGECYKSDEEVNRITEVVLRALA